ncbi:MAG: HYR domain-containing protein, partial [Chitinophagales bacterium]
MRKANSTLAQNFWGWLMVLALTAFAGFNASAQCSLTCNNLVQISLDEDCSVTLNEDMILEGTYNQYCPNGNFQVQAKINNVWVPASGNFVATSAHIGQTISVRVRDLNSGNMCWGYILVEDKLVPEIECEDIYTTCASSNYSPSFLANTLGISEAFPTASDNCSGVTRTFVDTWFDLPCGTVPQGDLSGYVRRVWTVADAQGNTNSCTQFVYLERSHVGDVEFPEDVEVSCSNPVTSPAATGAPYVTFNNVDFTIYPSPAFCELQATYADQILPVCDGTYKILRTWTVYDWCTPTSPFPPSQNPQYYIQLIKVVDNAGPTWTCPEDMTVSTDAYTCCATVDLPNVVMNENCSRINRVTARVEVYDQYTGDLIATHDLNGSLSTFPGNNLWDRDTMANYGLTPCLPVGNHKVTYSAYDDCGNSNSCQFDLTVEDQTPPTAVCDEFTQVALGIDGTAQVNALTFDDGSYDNCSQVYFKVRRMDNSPCQSNNAFRNQAKFCCSDIGQTIQVILRVYDVDPGAGDVSIEALEGHYNDCMINVLVEDKIKPVCQAPANVTVSCEAFDASLWAYGQATATDNCSNPTITGTVAYNQFDSLCNKGTITRRWTAVDAGGNTASCSQRIVVTYNQNYYVKFPDDRLITTCDGTGNYGQPEFYGAQDCELMAVSYTDELFTVIPDACFKIERTWTVLNWCQYNPNGACIEVPNPEPNAITNNAQNRLGVTVSAPGTTVPGWEPTVRALTPGAPATNFSSFWNKEANCYKYKQIIKVIDTQDPSVVTPSAAEYCDYSTNDANMWNAMYWYDNTINSHDLCEGDANIELTATDACSGANIRFKYLLFLDLDGNGSMETVVNSNNAPGYPFPVYNNVQ